MLPPARLQLVRQKQKVGCCCNSSLNRNRQPALRPVPGRHVVATRGRHLARISQDPAASTSQAVPDTSSQSVNSQGHSSRPAGAAPAIAEGGHKPDTYSNNSSQEEQQDASSPASSSSPGPTALTAADLSSPSSSTQGRNGSSAAADPVPNSTSSRGDDYIYFSADELQQDVPAPSTSSSATTSADSSSDSSSTSLDSTGLATSSSTSTDSEASESHYNSRPAVGALQQDPQGQPQPQQPQQAEDTPQPQQQPQQQQQQQQQQQTLMQQDEADTPPPLPTHLSLSIGPVDEAADEAEPPAAQDVFVPPPLIDPNVDIANDPAYAIRLMDILDQISTSSNSSTSFSSLSAPSAEDASAASAGSLEQQQQQPRFRRQPGAFCANCCTPLDALRPSASCSTCGHFAADDHLLFSQGVSSAADLAAHTPLWLLKQQQLQGAAPGSAAAAVKAGIWRRQQQQQQQQELDSAQGQAPAHGDSALQQAQPQEAGASCAVQDDPAANAAAAQQRAAAAALLQQARQLLQEAGVLKLPKTLLAWEDASAQQEGAEAAMHLHRGLLPPNHERPERLRAIEARLKAAGLIDCCERLPPREASDAELLAVHSPGLIAAVAALSHANSPADLNRVAEHLAPDALGNRYTHRAARTAAGTAAEMARQLVQGTADNGIALVRPLGHSAGIDTTEAGNYFNNAAVAVRAAQHAGARRVMVIDWGIHHCKGTEEIFAEDPNVVVLSLHRYGSSYYPGTGAATDIGVGRGRGRTINVAWSPPVVMDKRGQRVQVDAPPVSDGDFLTAWHMLVLPVVAEFRPDLILVSAGFDAVDKDPLGHYRVHPECFGHLTALLKPFAPLGLLLEGGYNLAATAACVEACLRALLGERPAPLRGTRSAGVTGWSSVLRTLLVHQEHWQSLGLLNFLQLASTPPAAAGEWEEDDSLELQGQEWGEEGEEGEEEYESSDEQELQDDEYSQALATAAEAGSVIQSSGAGVSADTPAQLQQLLSAAQADESLLQQLMRIMAEHKVVQASEEYSRQQREQRAAAAAAAAAEAGACVQSQLAPTKDNAQSSSSSSSKGPRDESWSAGGFLEDPSAVDSGSDDEVMSNVPNWGSALGSTDWGWQQLDEESQDNLPWYEVEAVQQQLKKAEHDAAAAVAAAAAAAEAAAAAAQAAVGAAGALPEDAAISEAIQEVAVAAVAAEATLNVAVEATKEAEEAAAALAAAAGASGDVSSSEGSGSSVSQPVGEQPVQ